MKKKYRNIKLIIYKRKKDKENKKEYQKNYMRSNLVDLYKTQMLGYNKTRDIKWKFNVSIWILFIIATYFKHVNHEIFSKPLVVVLIIIALLAHYIFLYVIQRSLAGSKRIMSELLGHMNGYNKTEDILINTDKYERMYVLTLTDYLWIAFQIVITFFILLIFFQV